MDKIFSLPFTFRGKEYYLLARDVTANLKSQIRVTVMNGDLERILSGNNVFMYEGSMLYDEPQWRDEICGELRAAIRKTLRRFLNEKKMGSDALQPDVL